MTNVPEAQRRPVDVDLCPVCAATKAVPRFAFGDGRRVVAVCTGCGLGRVHPSPSPEELAGWYPPEYYGATGAKFEPVTEFVVRLVGARRARFLMRGLPAGARVLDVGCGRGVLLAELAERGCEVHGVEMSATAVEGADPRAHIRIAPDLARAGYAAESFDEIILWHVLEHLPDPTATLRECARLLKTGGRMVVAVPNASSWQARWGGAAWFHLDLPRHLYHFPLAALRTLLVRCGFECRSTHHFSLRQNPFGWLQTALNGWMRLPRNGLYVLLQRRPAGVPLPFNLRTRVLLRAAYAVGMPFAIVLSIVEAVCRQGGTVHVVAVKRRS